MTNIELTLNQLAEVLTTDLTRQENPQTLNENKKIARKGGKFAGETRQRYEEVTGRKVVSSLNASDKKMLEIKPKQ